jgi:hypothetical protein
VVAIFEKSRSFTRKRRGFGMTAWAGIVGWGGVVECVKAEAEPPHSKVGAAYLKLHQKKAAAMKMIGGAT